MIFKICLLLVKKCKLLTAEKMLDVNRQHGYCFMGLGAGQAGKSCIVGYDVTVPQYLHYVI